jgi:hypothetical protein
LVPGAEGEEFGAAPLEITWGEKVGDAGLLANSLQQRIGEGG